MGQSQSEGTDMKAETFLPDDYRPAEDEPFMNERQTEYFRRKLNTWKTELLAGSRDTIETLQDGTRNIPDVADRASEETDRALELRTRDRQRKLARRQRAGENGQGARGASGAKRQRGAPNQRGETDR